MSRNDNYKELGTIRSTRFGPEPDRGWKVCEVFLDFDGGGTQGFVFGLGDKPGMAKQVRGEICALFGVRTEKELVGQKCYALRCFGGWNEVIEGIETLDGKRFTRTGWARRMGYPVKDILAERKESTLGHIKALQRQIADNQKTLGELDGSYVNWEE